MFQHKKDPHFENILAAHQAAKEKHQVHRAEKAKILDYETFEKSTLDHARYMGWTKETKFPILIEKYLKPIHAEYLRIIDELEEAIKQSDYSPDEQKEVLISTKISLNTIMQNCHRIGSTMSENISHGNYDLLQNIWETYKEYAVRSMIEFVDQIIFQE